MDHTAEGRHSAVAIDLLGPLNVWCAGRAVVLPKRRRSLLGLLALRAGAVVAVEDLVSGLWGDDAPPTAVRTLHSHLAKLGATLATSGAERLIRRRDPGYLLDLDGLQVDRAHFEELTASGLRHAARGRFAEAARAYGSGLALWRGKVLADCDVHGWAAADAAYLEDLRLDADEGLIAAGLAAPAPDVAIGAIERLVAEHPLRERLWELLMVALQLSGRTGEALEAYHRARRTLVEELGTEPGEGLRQVEAGILDGGTDPRTLLRLGPAAERYGTAASAQPLPRSLDRLIGRRTEIERVSELLGGGRLVTLTGFGGIGKTRLATEVADLVAPRFDEVHFIDLAALGRGDLLAPAVAGALGVREQPGVPIFQRLAQQISHDRILIVLDNCEHLATESALLAHELLTRCGHVRLLATSHGPLQVTGETVAQVAPLDHPDPATVSTAEDLLGYDAVTLFADRARIRSIEELSARDAHAVAVICAGCDGLPLAIELAAARVRLLTLPEIARGLRDRFELLADGPRTARPHHRTLRATVEWSYRLLTADERSAIRRLSVNPGKFSRYAAASICPDLPISGLLTELMDKSLLKPVATSVGMYYRLAETIKDYAAEQLAARPAERRQAHRDHALNFVRAAEVVERRMQSTDIGRLLDFVPHYHEDVRAAMTWLTREGRDPESALRLAVAVWRFHHRRGHYREGRSWLKSALDLSDTGAAADWIAAKLAAFEFDYQEANRLGERSLRACEAEGDVAGVARATALLAGIARERGEYAKAIELGQECRTSAEQGGNPWGIGNALQMLGLTAWLSGDHRAAAGWSGRALRLLTQIGDREREAWCLIDLGAAAHYLAAPDEASQHLTRALALFQDARFTEGIAWSENLLGLVALDQADPYGALPRLAQSLGLHSGLGDRWRQASVLDALARATCAIGQHRLAARLLGAGWAIRDAIGTPIPACELSSFEQTLACVRDQLGPEAFERLHTAGRSDVIEHLQHHLATLHATQPLAG